MKARSGTPLNSSASAPSATGHTSFDAITSESGAAAAADRVHDLSILRQPIGTSISGFEQVRQAYETGTDEIRHLLGRECDVIFECRVCRNIFRSLANFLSHKRIYCAARFSRQKHCHFREEPDDGGQQAVAASQRLESDCTQIVQLERDFAEARPTTVHGAKGAFRDLSSVIERLRRRESAGRVAVPVVVPDVKMETEAATATVVVKQEPPSSDCVVLQLDRIAESTAAVFQTVRTADVTAVEPMVCTTDSIKTDVLELHYLQQNGPMAVLDEQGKAQPVVNGNTATETNAQPRIACDICQMQFETEKTLRLHISKNHVTSTYVYPCPSCTQTFLRPFAVMKHLNLVHKKSIRRLRQMRETILRRRTRISQIQVKGPSRELARLQQSDRVAETQRVAWPDNYNGIMSETLVGSASVATTGDGGDAVKHRASSCTHCGKSFERRAALSTHLKTCPVKLSNGGSASSSLLDMDESNSNSTDSFMAMLNREKSVQARIHEQENKLLLIQQQKQQRHKERNIVTAAVAKPSSSSAASSRAQSPAMPDNDSAAVSTHRRKRAHARKSAPTAMHLSGDNDFHWDETADLSAAATNGNSIVVGATTATTSSRGHPKFDLNAIDSAISSIAAAEAADASADQTVAQRPKKARLMQTLDGSTTADIEQRPTDCTICDKKFANLSNLRRHVAMFHYREKKFACKLCAFRAFRKVDVLNHITSAHRGALRNGAQGGEEGGEAQVQLADATEELVEFIEVDKNKYTEERGRAVAAAVERMNERDGAMDAIDFGAGALVEDPDGDDSRTEIIIPVLNRFELDEIDFELIPMEEFTIRSNDVTANNSTAASPVPTLPVPVTSAVTTNAAPPVTTAVTHRRQRGRPKGSGKSQMSAARTSTPNGPPKASQALARLSVSDLLPTSAGISPVSVAPIAPNVVETPPASGKASKLIRHASSNSSSSEETTAAAGRRPIRNRVKIANKDFVYDLSSLLKKETEVRHYAPILGRNQQKRKAIAAAVAAAALNGGEGGVGGAGMAVNAAPNMLNTGHNSGDSVASAADTFSGAQQSIAQNSSVHSEYGAAAVLSVSGAALAMAQLAVAQHRACFNRPPEMPAAHAIVPAKIIALRRSVGSEWHVINAPNERRATVPDSETPTTTTTTESSAVSSRRASTEQLMDLLVVKRRDSLMDKYHTVAKQTQRRLHKTLNATGTVGRPKASATAAATSPSTAARKKKSAAALGNRSAADVDFAALMPRLLPFDGAYREEHAASNGDSPQLTSPPPSGTSSVGPLLTPGKQRLTAVERLAEIKQRNRLQETMRKLNISDESDGPAPQPR